MSGHTYSNAPVTEAPITLDSIRAAADELGKAWRESDDELRGRVHALPERMGFGGLLPLLKGDDLDRFAATYGIKRLADDRPVVDGIQAPAPSLIRNIDAIECVADPSAEPRRTLADDRPLVPETPMAPTHVYRIKWDIPFTGPDALPTQYRRAPNGRGYRVLDVSSELALMRQDDGLRVTAPLGVVAAWTLEHGPETMTAAEQHEARGRLALEWPLAGETKADTLRRVSGDVEWARSVGAQHCKRTRAPGAWEGAVRL